MKNKLKIALGGDHAGFALKERIIGYLKGEAYEIKDFGTYSDERADYPDFAHTVAASIEKGQFDCGVLICGSGNGISMAANKHIGIRSAVCWNEEIARLARAHNDANIIALPSRFISEDEAIKSVKAFLNSKFEGGRHTSRVSKINC